MGGLLHLVQRGGDWAGLQPAQAPPRCTKCILTVQRYSKSNNATSPWAARRRKPHDPLITGFDALPAYDRVTDWRTDIPPIAKSRRMHRRATKTKICAYYQMPQPAKFLWVNKEIASLCIVCLQKRTDTSVQHGTNIHNILQQTETERPLFHHHSLQLYAATQDVTRTSDTLYHNMRITLHRDSVILSRVSITICPLRSGIRWKRLNISSQFFTIQYPSDSSFTSIKHFHKIPTGSPHAGALNTGGV